MNDVRPNPHLRTTLSAIIAVGAALSMTLSVAVAAPLAGTAPRTALRLSPTKPSLDEIKKAQQAAQSKADQIAALQGALDASSAALDAARAQAETAAEDYNGALIALNQKQQAAKLAQKKADAATLQYQKARASVAAFTAAIYRQGGDFGSIGAFLGGTGPQDAIDKANVTDTVGAQKQQAINLLLTARTVSTWANQQATAALADQKAATRTLASAKIAADLAERQAVAQVAAIQQQQVQYTQQLATLQATTVALIDQRQKAIQAEKERQAAEARRRAEQAERERLRREKDQNGSGQGDSGGSNGGRGSSSAQDGQIAVAWAKRQLGKPYVWAADGPGSFDCSGLTMRAWQQAGFSMVHYAASQYVQTARVAYSDMRPGDLIFYANNTSRPSTIHHVTMYIGNGLMIEAPHTGANVRIVPIRWSGSMDWAGRP
jgi:cell wall-associated NlpC family hydrolase